MKTQRRKITKPLSVRLTDEDVLKYGREAARAVADRESIENDFDSIKKDYKARIDEQSAIVAKLSPRIHSSQETRDVVCEEVKNWTDGTVVVTRLDTGEVTESRPMREDEKQMEVELEDDGEPLPKVKIRVMEPEVESETLPEAPDLNLADGDDYVAGVAEDPPVQDVSSDESNPFA